MTNLQLKAMTALDKTQSNNPKHETVIRTLFTLRFVQGQSLKACSKSIGRTVEACRQLEAKALHRLKLAGFVSA